MGGISPFCYFMNSSSVQFLRFAQVPALLGRTGAAGRRGILRRLAGAPHLVCRDDHAETSWPTALLQLRDSLPRIKEDLEAVALKNVLAGRHPDILLRYETANDRQLYEAIDQLERLQRQRAGDYVPPPVKVGVSTDL